MIKVRFEKGNGKGKLLIEARGQQLPRELTDLAWDLEVSGKLSTTYVADEMICANVKPWDWRGIQAAEFLADKAKELSDQSNGDDLFGQVLDQVQQQKYNSTYREKRKSREAEKAMRRLAGRVRTRNQKARSAGLADDLTVGQAEAILKSTNGKCPNCLKRSKWYQMELAHIKPHSEGGGSTATNIRALCKVCNRKQGATS